MPGILYLVATPIGNMGDISSRAAETLASVDFIAAEDTRVALKILNHLEIKKPMVSYYDHNKIYSGEKIISRLMNGENCALVTDAGMPAISDPGEDLVRQCAERGIATTVIPGPCAVPVAIALSALPTGRFTFEGFLSTAPNSRKEHLDSLKNEMRTMVFYEAPHKLCRTLHDFVQTFGGNRKITVCRELTKIHEEILHTTLSEAEEHFSNVAPRGEFVLVIAGAEREKEQTADLDESADKVLRMCSEQVKMKDAVRQVSEETGISRNILYNAALRKKEMSGHDDNEM